MPKTIYTLQDWYLERTDSKISTGQCESCNLDFKPEQLIWSEVTQNFSCEECFAEAVKTQNENESKQNISKLPNPIGVSVNFYPR